MADMNAILEKNIALYNGRSLNCAETVLASMCEYMGVESALVPRIATAFGGGMGGTQSVCGTVTGALMALGIWAGREPGGDQAPARALAERFLSEFAQANGALTCRELSGIDMKDPAQMEAFRAPGGRHHTVCNECVRWACSWLAREMEAAK